MSQKFNFLAIAFISLAIFCQVKAQLSCANVTGLNATESNIIGQWFAIEVNASAVLMPSFVNVSCLEVTVQNATNLTANVHYSKKPINNMNVNFTAEAISKNVSGTYGYNFTYTYLNGSQNIYTIKIVNSTNNMTLVCGYQQINSNNSFGLILSRYSNYSQVDLTDMETNSSNKYTFANGFNQINQNQSECAYSPPSKPNSGDRTLPGIFASLIFMYSVFKYINN